MKNILIICTSNKDRSPSLQRELQKRMPEHVITSVGTNDYFTMKHGTQTISHDILSAADFIVFCEDVHRNIASDKYGSVVKTKPYIVLNLGHFDKDNMQRYVEKAMGVLSVFKSLI